MSDSTIEIIIRFLECLNQVTPTINAKTLAEARVEHNELLRDRETLNELRELREAFEWAMNKLGDPPLKFGFTTSSEEMSFHYELERWRKALNILGAIKATKEATDEQRRTHSPERLGAL